MTASIRSSSYIMVLLVCHHVLYHCPDRLASHLDVRRSRCDYCDDGDRRCRGSRSCSDKQSRSLPLPQEEPPAWWDFLFNRRTRFLPSASRRMKRAGERVFSLVGLTTSKRGNSWRGSRMPPYGAWALGDVLTDV